MLMGNTVELYYLPFLLSRAVVRTFYTATLLLVESVTEAAECIKRRVASYNLGQCTPDHIRTLHVPAANILILKNKLATFIMKIASKSQLTLLTVIINIFHSCRLALHICDS